MANTGRKIVTTLKDQDSSTGTDLGHTKPNVVSDPDYIAPYIDTTDCPVTYTTTCPAFIGTGLTGSATYEANIDNSVVTNPALASVTFRLMDGVSTLHTTTYTFPTAPPNYFTETFSVAAGSYTFFADYKNSSNVIITTCTLSSITVS